MAPRGAAAAANRSDGGGDDANANTAAAEAAFRPLLAVTAYCLAFLGFGAASNIVGPSADALAGRLPGSPPAADLWVVFFSGGVASLLGSVPSGWLIDLHPRIPGHRLLSVAMATQAAGLVAMHRLPWARASLWGLVACNCAVSLTLNLVNTGVNTYSLWSARRAVDEAGAAARRRIGRVGRRRRRGDEQQGDGDDDDASGVGAADPPPPPSSSSSLGAVLVNAVHLFFGAGALCAPLLVMLSSKVFGDPLAAFDLSAGIVLLIAVVFWFVPSPPRPRAADGGGGGAAEASEGEQDEVVVVEEQVSVDGIGVGGDNNVRSPLLGGSTGNNKEPDLWSTPQGRLVLLLASAFALVCVGMEVGVGGWSATFARERGGQDAQAARASNSLYWLAFTLGRLVASAAAAVTTPTQGLAASLPVLVAGAAVALGGGGSGSSTTTIISPGRLATSLALFGVGYAPQFANVIAALDNVAPVPGWVNGLLGGVASAGVMVVPPLLGLAAASDRLRLGWGVLPWAVLLATGLQAACLVGQSAAVAAVASRRSSSSRGRIRRGRNGGAAATLDC